MEEKIIRKLQEGIEVKEKLKDLAPLIAGAVRAMVGCIKGGGKILICGNGGSAADSQHIAAELIGRFKRERRALPALALTTDTSILTSLANDYSFDKVFSRQLEAHAAPGDLLLLISTSGDSRNVIEATRLAKSRGLKTVALLGKDGGAMLKEVELGLVVPSDDTARIQEGHAAIYHILCDLVEEEFCDDDRE